MKSTLFSALFLAAVCLCNSPLFSQTQSNTGYDSYNNTGFGNSANNTGFGNSSNNTGFGNSTNNTGFGTSSTEQSSSSSSNTWWYKRCWCNRYHNPGCPPKQNVPFDGGLTLLVGAGMAYGFKRGYDKRKKDKAADAEREA